MFNDNRGWMETKVALKVNLTAPVVQAITPVFIDSGGGVNFVTQHRKWPALVLHDKTFFSRDKC